MGIAAKIKRIKGELEIRLLKLKFQERDNFKELYRAHAKLYTNLYESRLVENALNVGDKVPINSVNTFSGLNMSFKSLLEKGPIVLAFFRGTWCGYCNTEVTYLQENYQNFEELGATVIAISPQSIEHSKSMVEHQGITYPVVSDFSNSIARQFGLTYTLTEEVVQAIQQSFGTNLRKFYGKEDVEVPLPATYVIDQDGVIAYAFIEEDHRKRADVGEVLTAVRRCKINKHDYVKKAGECNQVVDCIIQRVVNHAKNNCKLQKTISEKKKERKEEKRKTVDLSTKTSFSNHALLFCLENEEFLQSFKDYLAKTFCTENLLFYFDSRDYYENFEKQSPEERQNIAQRIFNNYIKLGSELEVNIDDQTRESVVEALKTELTQNIFQSANQEVFKIMDNDSFHKWRRTKEFDSLWKKNGSPAVLAVDLSFLH